MIRVSRVSKERNQSPRQIQVRPVRRFADISAGISLSASISLFTGISLSTGNSQSVLATSEIGIVLTFIGRLILSFRLPRAFRRCFLTPQATIPVTIATKTTHKPTPRPTPVFVAVCLAAEVGVLEGMVGLLLVELIVECTDDDSGPGKKSDEAEAVCFKVVPFVCI